MLDVVSREAYVGCGVSTGAKCVRNLGKSGGLGNGGIGFDWVCFSSGGGAGDSYKSLGNKRLWLWRRF